MLARVVCYSLLLQLFCIFVATATKITMVKFLHLLIEFENYFDLKGVRQAARSDDIPMQAVNNNDDNGDGDGM